MLFDDLCLPIDRTLERTSYNAAVRLFVMSRFTQRPGEKCLRCDEQALVILPESDDEITFYKCQKCGWNFAKKPAQELHDRWLSPISLVLYLVTSNKDPRERIDQIADLFIEQKNLNELSTIVQEIDRELKKPTQCVTEILPFDHSPSEKIVREFLRGVSIRLKEHLRKPQEDKDLRKSQEKKHLRTLQEFDGPCSVCGKPGSVQQIPGVSASGCFCEDHVPSGTIKPIHIFIALGLLLGLGRLIYTLFLNR